MTTRNLAAWGRNPSSGKLDYRYDADGVSKYPTYTPLVNIKPWLYANGAASPIFNHQSPIVTTERAGVTQSKCIKVFTNPSNPSVTCGGHLFGGRMNLPVDIPVGKTVWQRMKMYFPSEFSLGYSYAGGTVPTAASYGCGAISQDGGSQGTKWLVFSPDVGTARAYMLAPNAFRAVDAPAGGSVTTEPNGGTTSGLSITFPRDQWVTIETAVKVSKTGAGYLRVWINGVLAGQLGGSSGTHSTIAAEASAIRQYGLGDYWNGAPWTDGAAGRNFFYVDEVLVATDVDGYGMPDAVDSNGYPMIGVDVNNVDFVGV